MMVPDPKRYFRIEVFNGPITQSLKLLEGDYYDASRLGRNDVLPDAGDLVKRPDSLVRLQAALGW